ncbi:MAG: hypothetical protein H0X46_01020, partial [Bacteroidetes bacterium]|nr:hypothetical protein [Bacteroidota bacterium]
MFKNIRFENIIKVKRVAGIEICLLPDGGYEINGVLLKRDKSQVFTEKKVAELKEIALLSTFVDPKSPVVLTLTGKGIIHRKVSVSENDSLQAILNKVLPNANIDEFYIQKQEGDAIPFYVSVIRKSSVDPIVEELNKNKSIHITECYLGPFLVNSIIPLIDTAVISNEHLYFSSHKLLIRESKIQEILISDVPPMPDILKVGDELLEGKLVVPFAAALSAFVDGSSGLINSESLKNAKKEFKEKQKFQLWGWSLLIATFIILLANYFVFDHYWKKQNDINSALQVNQSSLKRYELLNVEYTQKKEFLLENGLLENSRTSFYADKLAASVPASIQLLEMEIHP